jgi:hypothetical protein
VREQMRRDNWNSPLEIEEPGQVLRGWWVREQMRRHNWNLPLEGEEPDQELRELVGDRTNEKR